MAVQFIEGSQHKWTVEDHWKPQWNHNMQKHGGGRGKKALFENQGEKGMFWWSLRKLQWGGFHQSLHSLAPWTSSNKVNTPLQSWKKSYQKKKEADLNSFPASRIRNSRGFSLLLSSLARWKANIWVHASVGNICMLKKSCPHWFAPLPACAGLKKGADFEFPGFI